MTTFTGTPATRPLTTGHRPRRLVRARVAKAAWWLFECALFAAALAMIFVVGAAWE